MTFVRPLLLTALFFVLLAPALLVGNGAQAQSQSSRPAAASPDPYGNASVSEAVRQIERAHGGRLTFAQQRIIGQAAATRRDEMRAANQKFRATAARALGLTVAELDAKDRALREQERQRQREQEQRQQQKQQQQKQQRQQQQQQRQRYQANPDDQTTRRRSSSRTRRPRRKPGTRRGSGAEALGSRTNARP